MAADNNKKFQPTKMRNFLVFYERNTRSAKRDVCIRYTTYTFHRKQMTPGFCNINAHWSDDPAIAGVSLIYLDGVGVSLEVVS